MAISPCQDLVSAFGQWRAVRSPGDLNRAQSVTTCSTVWVGWPHGHEAASCMPQRWRVSPTRAVPERCDLVAPTDFAVGQHRAAVTGWAGDRQIELEVGQHRYGRSMSWEEHSCLWRDGQRVARKVDATWGTVGVSGSGWNPIVEEVTRIVHRLFRKASSYAMRSEQLGIYGPSCVHGTCTMQCLSSHFIDDSTLLLYTCR